jgi:glycerophosphoryl diester phosphodiesterase
MPAFAGAVALGYRYVETDAHVTADGVVLAFHDDRLERVTDRRGIVAEMTWSDVRRARVDGIEPIVLLEDLLGEWPDLRVNIDPKHDAVVTPLADLLRRTGAVRRVCVGSFSDRRIQRLRYLLGPELCTSLGPGSVAALRLASLGLSRRAPGGSCVQVPVGLKHVPIVDDRFVRTAHRFGLPVHVWTVDEPGEMDRLLDLGVDGIMTDRPAILRDVLERRGLWAPA